MPMADQDLRNLLERLQQEIERTRGLDKRGSELIGTVHSDVRELLSDPARYSPPPHTSKLQHLEESIRHLETTHPVLTALLVETLQALSNAGI